MAKSDPNRIVQLGTRTSARMRDALQAAADANGRSLNGEIVARLERSLDPDAQIRASYVRLLVDAFERGLHKGGLASNPKLRTFEEQVASSWCFKVAIYEVFYALVAAQPDEASEHEANLDDLFAGFVARGKQVIHSPATKGGDQ